jgi:hypothetical protein
MVDEPVFPVTGSRARLVKRFERDFWEWLATPEGRFARYCAARERAFCSDEPGRVASPVTLPRREAR